MVTKPEELGRERGSLALPLLTGQGPAGAKAGELAVWGRQGSLSCLGGSRPEQLKASHPPHATPDQRLSWSAQERGPGASPRPGRYTRGHELPPGGWRARGHQVPLLFLPSPAQLGLLALPGIEPGTGAPQAGELFA